jgi:methylase of polypeptide subunit release factors
MERRALTQYPVVTWNEADKVCSARWRSESGVAPPQNIVIADDTISANTAYRLASEGTALLWRGDFQNARQLLLALGRRAGRKPRNPPDLASMSMAEIFQLHRQTQARRAQVLSMLLLPFERDHSVPLRRAPDVRLAGSEARGTADAPYLASLRELLGLIGAHEWRKNGVAITALDASIHPHYGVFAPVRSEYLDLAANAPLPKSCELAFDIGTGSGVLAAVLARRGIARVVATDNNPRALICARDNLARLGLNQQVEVIDADLFPPGRAPLVVCNPPWVPAQPSSALEQAVYDPDSRMLRGFLGGLADHLEPGGEGWLVLSDIAEHLGLRSRAELLALIDGSGLRVLDRTDVRPGHRKVFDHADPLHAARAAEVTSLWRLAVR